ncbi:MAG: FAD-binding oxidoreductase [Myxococcota bacterium]|jgi:glycine/D-amino acid oxidase-like deaminating enzyme|nr:FAD-binding oxidoreductase [Myxococcota bacterium]
MPKVDESPGQNISFWHTTTSQTPLTPLAGDIEVDVAIVGGGFTGLWTAYYLKSLDPGLGVAIVEANFPGYGASGRNGGWAVGEMAGMATRFADPETRESAIRLQRALFDTVDEIGRVAREEGIDCHYAKGGTINLATAPIHVEHLQAEVAHWASLGFGEEDFRWLEADEIAKRVRSPKARGALFSPHCAAIHPFRLVSGLVDVLLGQGVQIFSETPAIRFEKDKVSTPNGNIKASMIVQATEAYTDSLPGRRRQLLPFYSMMIATEPLSQEIWDEIGLAARETFGDPRRMVIYGQRTADDRIAFGARGGYQFGSRIRSEFSPEEKVFEETRQSLEELFPVLKGVGVTHRWGGALGIPRDWRPVVGIDRQAGKAWAGGYVGEGVAATNLAGRTLADLILEQDSPRVDLAWVGASFGTWEPEPLRWLGISIMNRLGDRLDGQELAGASPSRALSSVYDWIVKK